MTEARLPSVTVPTDADGRSGITDHRLAAVIDHMRQNHHLQIPVAQLADLAGMSPFHFIRVFKRAVGEPPAHHLRSLRVAAAREYLLRGDLTITDIAYLCGFASSSHLSSAFRACTGLSPTQFRRRQRVFRTDSDHVGDEQSGESAEPSTLLRFGHGPSSYAAFGNGCRLNRRGDAGR